MSTAVVSNYIVMSVSTEYNICSVVAIIYNFKNGSLA